MKDKDLMSVVNGSGFPLQIGIQQKIMETNAEHGWKVIYSEHSWSKPYSDEMGFIDLVVEDSNATFVLIIECKRVRDSSWLFLAPDAQNQSRKHAKSWVSFSENYSQKYFSWQDLTMSPASVESGFCVVHGQDAKSKPMLERISAELVSSTEGFAEEDRALWLNRRESLRMFFNIIVTTAKLKVCNFSTNEISIDNGEISESSFTEVPFLRFRKQLSASSKITDQYPDADYSTISKAKENTIFVVNSMNFIDFLKQFDVDDSCVRSFKKN